MGYISRIYLYNNIPQSAFRIIILNVEYKIAEGIMRKVTIPALAALFVAAMTATQCGDTGSFVDSRDGRRYRTVRIGAQTWMAENLNFNVSGSVCYDNDESNCKKYGRLYDRRTAMKACPAGWRLPAREDWENMLQAIGGLRDKDGDYDVVGKKLKSKTGWNICVDVNSKVVRCNGNGTDEIGFSALPGGNRNADSSFNYLGISGLWWSAAKGGAVYEYHLYLISGYDFVSEFSSSGSYAYSVRCVRE